MINSSRFKNLQRLFYDKITSCCNPSTITLEFIKVTSTGDYTDFTGDSKREVGQEVVLRCFYMRNISDKQRDKYGISQEIKTVVYVSPLELEKKFGQATFPDYVLKSFSQINIKFLQKNYDIESIVELEPMHNGNNYICLAYQINLS